MLPGARKFTELGVQPRKKLDELTPIENTSRDLTSLLPGDASGEDADT